MSKSAGTRLLCGALACVVLTGCNGTLRLLGLRHETRPEIAVRPIGGQTPVITGSATQQGREDLLAGRIGAAIEQFQRALAQGEPIGPAANGMGVAYARLGQFEQAHRFFSEALAVEPDNEKYSENLARLLRSPLVAERHDADFNAPIVAVAAPPKTQPAPQARLTRLSRGEVALRTGAGTNAPTGALPRTAAYGAAVPGFKPLVRIEFADSDAVPSDSPAPGAASAASPAKEAGPVPRTIRFSADTRGFKPLVRFELRPR